MDEYKKTINYLLEKTQQAKNGTDACSWSQAAANLISAWPAGKELLNKQTTYKKRST